MTPDSRFASLELPQGHEAQPPHRIGRKNVLVGSDPHAFKIVCSLQLPPRMDMQSGGSSSGGTGGQPVSLSEFGKYAQFCCTSSLGNLIAGEFVPESKDETVFLRFDPRS